MDTMSPSTRGTRNLGTEQSLTRRSAENTNMGAARYWQLAIAAILVLTLISSGLVLAQTDPFTGTWKLNVAKSKFVGGRARKNETRIVISTPTGLKVDVDRTYADGTNQQFEYTSNLDGKSYPITGDAPYGADSVSMNLGASNTLTYKLMKGGKVIASGTSVVSADGRTLTITSKGTDASGQSISSIAVYDKQ
jgi:hypothetical protein